MLDVTGTSAFSYVMIAGRRVDRDLEGGQSLDDCLILILLSKRCEIPAVEHEVGPFLVSSCCNLLKASLIALRVAKDIENDLVLWRLEVTSKEDRQCRTSNDDCCEQNDLRFSPHTAHRTVDMHDCILRYLRKP